VKQKLAIFLDSAFWHGHPRIRGKSKLKGTYWIEKIKRNVIRDRNVSGELRHMGWRVVRIKEKALKLNPLKQIQKIHNYLQRSGIL